MVMKVTFMMHLKLVGVTGLADAFEMYSFCELIRVTMMRSHWMATVLSLLHTAIAE